jgi:hypothetical protein
MRLTREQIANVTPEGSTKSGQGIECRVQVSVLQARQRGLTDPELSGGISLRQSRLLAHPTQRVSELSAQVHAPTLADALMLMVIKRPPSTIDTAPRKDRGTLPRPPPGQELNDATLAMRTRCHADPNRFHSDHHCGRVVGGAI